MQVKEGLQTKSTLETLQERLEIVQGRIAAAAKRAGRAPEAVRLVGVTKGHPMEMVRAAADAGLYWIGENYVQEALAKMAEVHEPEVVWHMIGHVQSRKAPEVREHFDWVHSLDSLKLAHKLNLECDRRLKVLLECNVSGEVSKYGLACWPGADLEVFYRTVGEILAQKNLEVCGLMTMAPFFDEPQQARPYFRRLKELLGALRERFGEAIGNELSMGMSGDFEAAVEEGATIVRIGTAIFGARE